MRAQKQLDAFPQSANQAARQKNWGAGAVVSLRLKGSVISALDDIAERETEAQGRHSWNRITRSDLIKLAVDRLIAQQTPTPKQKAKKGKRK